MRLPKSVALEKTTIIDASSVTSLKTWKSRTNVFPGIAFATGIRIQLVPSVPMVPMSRIAFPSLVTKSTNTIITLEWPYLPIQLWVRFNLKGNNLLSLYDY